MGESPTSLSITAYRKSEFGMLQAFVPVLRALAVILALGLVGALLYSIYAAVSLGSGGVALAPSGEALHSSSAAALLAVLNFVLAELVRLGLSSKSGTRATPEKTASQLLDSVVAFRRR